ncbi:MAG: hypothetical protein KF861_23740 [Planctomycetaceae bacterium]|nr:hypothetical protein [Planctomycetaceae bacterium]
MALVEVKLHINESRLPPEIRLFLRDAEQRIEEFTEATRNHPVPAFVPSDFAAAYAALATIEEQGLAPGSLFCEWGSGFGVVTCLAAKLDFESYGIEIEPDLVREAELLARDHEISAEFVAGNFVPPGAELLAETPGEVAWLATDGANAYEEMGLNIDDFDVIYAYPWPGEDDLLGHLFDQYGADGALLVTYEGLDELRARRRVRRRQRR